MLARTNITLKDHKRIRESRKLHSKPFPIFSRWVLGAPDISCQTVSTSGVRLTRIECYARITLSCDVSSVFFFFSARHQFKIIVTPAHSKCISSHFRRCHSLIFFLEKMFSTEEGNALEVLNSIRLARRCRRFLVEPMLKLVADNLTHA